MRRTGQTVAPDICLVYFQGSSMSFALVSRCLPELEYLPDSTGNLGSPVQRLPLFSHLLLSKSSPFSQSSTVLLVIPPRSYYLSTNSPPSQPGLLTDYGAVLAYARKAYPNSKLVLYGHSLGGSGACCLLASIPSSPPLLDDASPPRLVDALILENPFPNVPVMIEESLYPSKCLPYHYLTAFVLDRWDALAALRHKPEGTLTELDRTPILFVSAEGDTLVKPELVRRMYEASLGARTSQVGRTWLSIKDRSHDDAWMAKGDWGEGVRQFLMAAKVIEAPIPRRADPQ
jgi:pimeloyl-ACP methyl ester carboxylesterase